MTTYSDTFTLSRVPLVSTSFAESLAKIKTITETAAVVELCTIIHDLDFDTHFFNILVKSTEYF